MQYSARMPCGMGEGWVGLGTDWQVVEQLTFDPSFPQLPIVSWLVMVYGSGLQRQEHRRNRSNFLVDIRMKQVGDFESLARPQINAFLEAVRVQRCSI
jgi:hypothetical protein